MNARLARNLTWLSALLLLLGAMVGAPEAGFGAAVLAALVALVPLRSPQPGWRIAGALLLVLSLALAWSLWPAAAQQRERYRARVTAATPG